jgi:hypothetical protein
VLTRLLAWTILSAGAGGGLLLALPALALAVAPWVGLALVLGVLVGGGVKLAAIRADFEYRAFQAQLHADTERFRLRLDAGRDRTGAIVDVYQYRVTR